MKVSWLLYIYNLHRSMYPNKSLKEIISSIKESLEEFYLENVQKYNREMIFCQPSTSTAFTLKQYKTFYLYEGKIFPKKCFDRFIIFNDQGYPYCMNCEATCWSLNGLYNHLMSHFMQFDTNQLVNFLENAQFPTEQLYLCEENENYDDEDREDSSDAWIDYSI